LGFYCNSTKGFNEQCGSHESLERSQILPTFKTTDRRFVDDIGTYEELCRVALSAKNETNMGHSSGNFYDNVTPLAVIDTTKEPDRIDLGSHGKGPFDRIKVVGDHEPIILPPLLFNTENLV
jgi:hypothetical protein